MGGQVGHGQGLVEVAARPFHGGSDGLRFGAACRRGHELGLTTVALGWDDEAARNPIGDLGYWKPGWVAPTPEEWRHKQRQILAAGSWIADGNYHETLALRLERADTVVIMDTPWTTCLGRALVRGLRRPGIQMPEGCDDTAWRRFRDEWGVAWRVFPKRRWEPQLERRIISQHGQHASVHVLAPKPEATEFLIRVGVNQAATEDD